MAPHIAIAADASRTDIELQRRGHASSKPAKKNVAGSGTTSTMAWDRSSPAWRSRPTRQRIWSRGTRREAAISLPPRVARHAALDEIRRIVEDLRPPALDELGLVGAIRQHAQRLPELEVSSSTTLPDRLPAAAEVAAYRIATEALTNVARHANPAAPVDVTLNGALAVTVTDNGRGSDRGGPASG